MDNLVETVNVDVDFAVTDEPDLTSGLTGVDTHDYELYRAAEDMADKYEERLTNTFEQFRDDGVMEVTEIEVTRPAGMGGSQAEIKLWADPDAVDVEALEYAVRPFFKTRVVVLVNGWWLFTGNINLIKQNQEGIITFEAIDNRQYMNQYTVRLDTREEGALTTDIVHDLLVGDGPFKEEELVMDIHNPETVHDAWGGGDHRPSIRAVIKQIAKLDGATVYIDEWDRIHYRDFPPVARHENLKSRITELDAGDSKGDNSRVIVEGPGINSALDLGFSTHGSTRAQAGYKQSDEDEKIERASLQKHHNVQSKRQANNVAVSEFMGSNLVKESGTIELVGTPTVTPWDHVALEELPVMAPIGEGTYSVQETKHIINSDDGYVTEVQLTEDLETLWSDMYDTEGASNDPPFEEADGLLGWLSDLPPTHLPDFAPVGYPFP